MNVFLNILNLPVDVYRVFQEFVSINNLMLTCKAFDPIRSELIYFKLDEEDSRQFYIDKTFRILILSKLRLPLHLLLYQLLVMASYSMKPMQGCSGFLIISKRLYSIG